MTYEELKKELKALAQAEKSLNAKYNMVMDMYRRKNAPIKLRRFERVTVRLKVSKDTINSFPPSKRKMRKYELGHEYSVTGCFYEWGINDPDGELRPVFFGSVSYSRYDEIVAIEKAEQIDGHCSECLDYKDGYCYLMGGKDISKKCAHHKVLKDDFTCPKYEEVCECAWGRHEPDRRYPNITVLKHETPLKYRVYSLNWGYFTEYKKEEFEHLFTFVNPHQ